MVLDHPRQVRPAPRPADPAKDKIKLITINYSDNFNYKYYLPLIIIFMNQDHHFLHRPRQLRRAPIIIKNQL